MSIYCCLLVFKRDRRHAMCAPYWLQKLSVPFLPFKDGLTKVCTPCPVPGYWWPMPWILLCPILSASGPYLCWLLLPICLSSTHVHTGVTALSSPSLVTSPFSLSFHLTQTFYSKISYGVCLKPFQFLMLSSPVPVFPTRVHGSLTNEGHSVKRYT